MAYFLNVVTIKIHSLSEEILPTARSFLPLLRQEGWHLSLLKIHSTTNTPVIRA